MQPFEGHLGAWHGTNAFRLMPTDPLHDAPMHVTASSAAGGVLVQVAYTWTHPEDGEQEGLLVFGPGEDAGTAAAFWADSWHQSSRPRILEGTLEDGVATVGYTYAGEWRWDIVVDARTPDVLIVAMHNVVPPSAAKDDMAAGPYAAMQAELRRAR